VRGHGVLEAQGNPVGLLRKDPETRDPPPPSPTETGRCYCFASRRSGIAQTGPETGYGYPRCGEWASSPVRPVLQFAEKRGAVRCDRAQDGKRLVGGLKGRGGLRV
jgi:hypothetical protein